MGAALLPPRPHPDLYCPAPNTSHCIICDPLILALPAAKAAKVAQQEAAAASFAEAAQQLHACALQLLENQSAGTTGGSRHRMLQSLGCRLPAWKLERWQDSIGVSNEDKSGTVEPDVHESGSRDLGAGDPRHRREPIGEQRRELARGHA